MAGQPGAHHVFVPEERERDILLCRRGHALEVSALLLGHGADNLELAPLEAGVDVAQKREEGGAGQDGAGRSCSA